jgi:GTP-binding protein EngB required for normal cell division
MSESHNKLINWYRKLIRPFLGEHEPEKLAEFDRDARRIEEIETDLKDHLPVCFLGGSGVGKSTLINALVFGAESYIPSGGVGPLTAQALTVCYGEHPAFEVHYHSVDRINRVIFGLERHYQAQLGKQGKPAMEAKPEELGLEMTGEDEASTLNALANDDGDDKEKVIEEIRKQAVLMIAGNQDAERDLPYLIDALLVAYGRKVRHGSQILPEDEERIKGIQIALQYGKNKRPFTCAEGKDENFRTLLHEHATGYLAPVIRDLKVRWNIEMLRGGLTLVDLPGVGVAGDVKAEVTEKWIKEHAKAIILVVDTRGVRETEAELLRNSGFLSRLLHASGDPSSDPVVLMVAVTHADKIAEQEYLDNKSRFPQKRKAEYLAEVFDKVSTRIRSQVEEQLTKVWKFSTGLSETKAEVLQGIIANLQVYPVSAPEYRKLLLDDEDSKAFIKTPEQSNIPQMVTALQQVVKDRTADRQQHLEAEENRFFNRLRARIIVTKTQWEEETRAEAEATELREALDEFIETEKLRLEFSNRQGAFREFLKSTLPTQIAKVVTEASVKARKEVYAYMQDLRFAHWKTLQAAVRRGGTFYGSRHIDLPRDFALRFEEPIAEVWGKTLLREIRKRTKEYAEDSVAQVERILIWAKSQGAKAKTSLLEAQVEVIKADAQKLNAVGKEAVDELREEVKNSLIKKIESPIRRRCKSFVDSHSDEGSGVKGRILDLFSELADVTIEAATEPAIELLTERFRQVEKQIREVFDEHQEYNDPITSASNAVVSSHEERLRRSDKKKRDSVLVSLTTIVEESPIPWENKTEAAVEAVPA